MNRIVPGLHGPLLLALTPFLLAGGAAPSSLCHLAQAAEGAPLPPQWRVQTVSGAASPRTEIVEWQDRKAIRFEASNAAAWYGVPVEEALEPGRGLLRWSWQIQSGLAGATLRERARDDAPARVAVVFGKASLLSRPRVLFYTWGNRESVGEAWRSHVSSRFGILVLRNEDDPTGRWLPEQRDLQADYRRVFGGEPEPVTAIGFMIDTEQTRAHAVAHLGTVQWAARP